MTDPDAAPDLALSARAGLPDVIAYLRPAHPKGGWRGHENFGELAAFWLSVHDSLRAEGAALGALLDGFRERRIDPAAFRQQLVPALDQHLGHLDMHHRIEDGAYFPKFRALDPRMAAAFDVLERDHATIHEALIETVGGARGLIGALADGGAAAHEADGYAAASDRLVRLLDRHLADEEEIVIPAMLVHGERSIS